MNEPEKSVATSRVCFGACQLDVQHVQVWRDYHEVKLTGKAFTVLCYFVAHPGQLVTKDDLFAAAWPETVVSDATLASCIQEVRQALGDEAKRPRYIETVHRRGFRFIAPLTTPPVVSEQWSVISKKEDQPGNGDLGPESDSQERSVSSDQTLDSRPQTLDTVAPTVQRSWSSRSFMLSGLLLLVGLIITVQYLSQSSLSPQSSILVPEEARPPLPLPDKPSIIVLPFTNMSEEAKQEYFSDGITEDLTSSLSRIPSLFVISRHSAFTYKGKSVKVQEVSKEMGVRYVLAGSVRRAGERVRVTAQLIDATTGEHVWSERYDRLFTETLVVQDEIVQKIMTTLKLQLTLEEQGYIVRKRTDNLEAYDSYLRGLASFFRMTKEDHLHARQLFEKAISLDSQYAEAYAYLAGTYYIEWGWRWSQDPQTLEQALAMGQRAVALDDALPMAHARLGMIYAVRKQYEQALAESARAVALNPNDADSYTRQAETLNTLGRPEEALQAVEHALRLNPRGSGPQLINLGHAYLLLGRSSEAISTLKSFVVRNPNWLSAHVILSASYLRQWVFQQEEDEQALTQAFVAAQRVLALNDANPVGHRLLGYVYLCQKRHEQALAEMERALTLDPEDASGYASLAEVLGWMGRTEEAVQMVEQALRRKPAIVDDHLMSVGVVYLLVGKPAEAIAPLKQYLRRFPNILGAHLALASAYSKLDQLAEARAEAAEVLRINPQFSLEVYKERVPLKDPAMLERDSAALRKAGLK